MEKNLFFTTNAVEDKSFELAELVRGISEWAATPVRLLAGYYSSVLGKEVSMRQTRLIIEAQAAFFAGIFPADFSIVARLLFIAWFISAARRCRKAF